MIIREIVKCFSFSIPLLLPFVLEAKTTLAQKPTARPDAHIFEDDKLQNSALSVAMKRCGYFSPHARHVKKIIDPMTFRLDDDSEMRLASIHNPLVRSPLNEADNISSVQLHGEALKFLERHISGRSITLWFARSRKDRYGRLLAQVIVERGRRTLWLQEELVRSGFALFEDVKMSSVCRQRLRNAEHEARRVRAGYWRTGNYRVLEAWKTRELLSYIQTFQIVAGRVRRASKLKNRIYLNFGWDWKSDFTVVIRTRTRRGAVPEPVKLEELEGKNVLVRGWIENRNGPLIRLRKADQIEIIADRSDP